MLTCRACRRTYLSLLISPSAISPLIAHARAAVTGRNLELHSWTQRRYATRDLVVTQPRLPVHTSKLERHEGEAKGRTTTYSRAALERELLYLPDPLKLADNTLSLLRQDDHGKALEIVRFASSRTPCTVSWNHIIDYNMSKGKVTQAIKTYNEMKKRAQHPDAYTYTILLRGLASNAHYPQSLSRALLIYNSMYADNSPVRPSVIHTNAVLKVCSRARDLDALFQIAAKLPTRGKSAPDNMTFTTIINAIRNVALDSDGNMTKEQQAARRREAILQGRRMWEDIKGRWQDGEILIDEEMVCAMGRLLILGEAPEDCDDVLSLVEQTMGVARLLPRIGDPARQTHFTSKFFASSPFSHPSTENEDAESSTTSRNSSPTSHGTPANPPGPAPPLSTTFTPLPLTSSSLPRSFARPSYQTLSVLIDACTHMSAISAGNAYWELLTSPPHSIVPDAENLHMYLRLLRLSRSSRLALSLLQDMLRPRSSSGLGITPQAKTFRIAMSTCVRDGNNPHAVGYATQILKAMVQHMEEPDVRVCEMFIGVLEKHVGKSDLRQHASPVGYRELLGALSELELVVANLRSLLAYGSFKETSSPSSSEEETPSDEYHTQPHSGDYPPHGALPSRRASAKDLSTTSAGKITSASRLPVRVLMQRMVSVYDRVLQGSREEMGRHVGRRLLERRARLNAFVRREVAREWEGRDRQKQKGVRIKMERERGTGYAKEDVEERMERTMDGESGRGESGER
ncbi:hypothetical protein MMC13_005674 [Lambiella insularis]|nr:hypothetical protein [Lambiella insularis]